MRNRSYVRDVFRNIGARSILAALIVFLLTVAATFVGGIQLYNSTKESIVLQGEVNAQQSAMYFDRYLLVRKNTVMLAGHVVDEMIRENQPTSEILNYLTAESLSIKKSIDKNQACVGLLSVGASSQHYVTFYDYTGNGTSLSDFKILDPWDGNLTTGYGYGYSYGYHVVNVNT